MYKHFDEWWIGCTNGRMETKVNHLLVTVLFWPYHYISPFIYICCHFLAARWKTGDESRSAWSLRKFLKTLSCFFFLSLFSLVYSDFYLFLFSFDKCMESVVGGEKEKEWMACLSIPHLLQRLPSDSPTWLGYVRLNWSITSNRNSFLEHLRWWGGIGIQRMREDSIKRKLRLSYIGQHTHGVRETETSGL